MNSARPGGNARSDCRTGQSDQSLGYRRRITRREAARALGLQIAVLNASTSREIEAAFSTLVADRADALFVAPDSFFTGRFVQFVTLAAHHRIPAAYTQRDFVEAGGLMSYGTDIQDMLRQVGVYTVKSSRA